MLATLLPLQADAGPPATQHVLQPGRLKRNKTELNILLNVVIAYYFTNKMVSLSLFNPIGGGNSSVFKDFVAGTSPDGTKDTECGPVTVVNNTRVKVNLHSGLIKVILILMSCAGMILKTNEHCNTSSLLSLSQCFF